MSLDWLNRFAGYVNVGMAFLIALMISPILLVGGVIAGIGWVIMKIAPNSIFALLQETDDEPR